MSPDSCAALRSWVLLLTTTVWAEGPQFNVAPSLPLCGQRGRSLTRPLPFTRVRGALQAQGLPRGLNEPCQLRRLEARRISTHVQLHPVSEHEAHPGSPRREGVRA